MPAIFISHSSLDPEAADDIKTALDRLGFQQVFLDFDKATGIDAGEDWEKRLYEELSRCHAVVLMLTPNWLASKWCFVELCQARALGKVILPIICKPLGERFILPEIQSVDLLDWNAGGLDKLEQRLRAITNELARGFKLDPSRPPYPGIHAFEAEDAAIYFGRDEETRAVIERLDARRTQGGARFLVLIGASGSGKSSLLKSGVLPQLSRRRREWVVLPCIRPEKAPVEMLAKSIAQQTGKLDDWRVWHATLGSTVAIDHFEELLRDLRVGDAFAATVLLPIDQFEEVFTVATPAERANLLHLLASALDRARDLPVMVIATGRSDVLEGLLEAGELAPPIETYRLTPMPLDRVSRLVEGPAQVAGLNVEKGLAEAIARDVESLDALPLLAYTLWLLYRRGSGNKKLSLAEYQSLGDPERRLNPIQNSVRLVADQAVGGLRPTDAELTALRNSFVPHLVRVRLDDGKRVRQTAELSELPNDAMPLIRALVEARLLSTRSEGESDGAATDSGKAVVEVTHEALFKAWPTLDRWLTEEHTFLSDMERIKSAHEILMQAPADRKDEALLGGLLLARAREWLENYPRRFAGRDIAPLRQFIEQSLVAEGKRRTRILETRDAALAMAKTSHRIIKANRLWFNGWYLGIALLALVGSTIFGTVSFFAESADAVMFAATAIGLATIAVLMLGTYRRTKIRLDAFSRKLISHKTLFEGALEAQRAKSLVRAFETTGLDILLKSTGPFTVFAPTDEAFAALSTRIRQRVFEPENTGALYKICTYHILLGENSMIDLINATRRGGGSVKKRTLEGTDLTIKESATGELMVTDSRGQGGTLIITNLFYANGVAHLVDTVLLPETEV